MNLKCRGEKLICLCHPAMTPKPNPILSAQVASFPLVFPHLNEWRFPPSCKFREKVSKHNRVAWLFWIFIEQKVLNKWGMVMDFLLGKFCLMLDAWFRAFWLEPWNGMSSSRAKVEISDLRSNLQALRVSPPRPEKSQIHSNTKQLLSLTKINYSLYAPTRHTLSLHSTIYTTSS